MNDVVERYGTPLYVYRLGEVRAGIRALREAVPEQVRIYYSLKANPHPAVVAETVLAGLCSEVSSSGELAVALAAGQPPDRCLMTGPGKTCAELDDALARGVRSFSVESEVDHERLDRAARRHGVAVDVMFRLNAVSAGAGRGNGRGSGLRMTGAPTQFGMAPEAARRIIERRDPSGPVRPVGLHVFPATNVAEPDDLVAEFTLSVETVAALLRQTGLPMRLVDIGGGFAAPFARPGSRTEYPNLRERLGAVLDDGLPGWRDQRPCVAVESGRYLAGGCGSLFTTVLDVKTSGPTTYVVLDTGVNALGGMSGLGRILVPDARPVGAPVLADADRRVSLVGPLCTPLDVLSRGAATSVPRVGDVLEIPNVGAYGLTASLLAFLSKPVPAEVVLEEDGSVVDARRLELLPVELGADEALDLASQARHGGPVEERAQGHLDTEGALHVPQ
jgi:diaminopimelate decarboxylase